MDVLVLRFHWFAELPYTVGLPFLDGFIMHLNDDEIQVWHRDGSKYYEYPYWWPKIQHDK
ncbi:hypothetical protein FJY84_06900 [Candidatus Bathyarchaeota archaeon]|nr:hypothetical protein [Candidatus Bathyarchaeota archaeon]